MNCPSHFPFLKLTHWSKWVFTLFLGDKGSFHYIFYQHHGYAVLYILQPRLFELIDHWHFAVVLCDANFNCRRWQRALFSKYLHMPPHLWSQSGVHTGYGAIACHMTIWKMTFYQGHLQLCIWVSADSVQVNCPLCPYVLQGVCTTIQIAFSLFHPPTSSCICRSLRLSHACMLTNIQRKKKNSITKEDCGLGAMCRYHHREG